MLSSDTDICSAFYRHDSKHRQSAANLLLRIEVIKCHPLLVTSLIPRIVSWAPHDTPPIIERVHYRYQETAWSFTEIYQHFSWRISRICTLYIQRRPHRKFKIFGWNAERQTGKLRGFAAYLNCILGWPELDKIYPVICMYMACKISRVYSHMKHHYLFNFRGNSGTRGTAGEKTAEETSGRYF